MRSVIPVVKPLALALALAGATPVLAVQFEMQSGVKVNVDTTLTYGVSVRASGRDPQLIGIANGGTSRSVNEDDGDLNFDKGKPFANIIKATTDVEVKYRNFGVFARGTAYYDFDLHDSNKLGPTGRDRLGTDYVGLDGFVYGSFEPMGKNLRVRVGRQVISWGESTFIANGINIINPADLSKFRVPGAELKEALIPTTGIWASQELTKALTVEGFYLTNWDRNKIDPRGTYFSNNDTISDDSDRLIVTFGRRKDPHFPLSSPLSDPAASVWVPRGADRGASDNGQYGAAFRYLAHELNNTELGFYYINYHSRSPFFSVTTGSPTTSSATVTSALTGGPLNAVHNGTARYFAEYPEDIKLYGVSFNTQGPAGVALQGEYSYRPNLPVQYATAEMSLAMLGLPNLVTGFTQIVGAQTGATAAALVPGNTYLQGYRRMKMSQLQVTATKSWPNVFGAQQALLAGEVGLNWFHNLASDVKFSGPATFLPGTTFGAALTAGGGLQPGGYLTDFSWGYRLSGRLEYANAFMGGTVTPRAAYSQDVKGTGPNFNEEVKSASVGISWDYQRKWVVDAQYTAYFGGRTYCGTDASSVPSTQPASWCSSANPLKDRDFYSISVSYSF